MIYFIFQAPPSPQMGTITLEPCSDGEEELVLNTKAPKRTYGARGRPRAKKAADDDLEYFPWRSYRTKARSKAKSRDKSRSKPRPPQVQVQQQQQHQQEQVQQQPQVVQQEQVQQQQPEFDQNPVPGPSREAVPDMAGQVRSFAH